MIHEHNSNEYCECPFCGDEVFDKYKNQASLFTAEDRKEICRLFTHELKRAPFNVIFNVCYDIGMSSRGILIKDGDLFGDPDKYIALAKASSKDTIQFLYEVKDKMLDNLSLMGQIWFRVHNLCDLDNPELILALHKEIYLPILKVDDKKVREELIVTLGYFHIEAYTIRKIEEYIRQEEKQKSKFQFFTTKLSEKKLLTIKKMLVDCKGGQYGDDVRYLEPISDDDWLYIFGRRSISNAADPKWLSSGQNLSSVMQMICGKGKAIRPLIKVYFKLDVPRADTRVLPAILRSTLESIIT